MSEAKRKIRFVEDCYRLYEQKMYHVAYAILKDEGQAEDAVQNAFLSIMQHIPDIRDPQSDDCKRYMITVIKHAAINIYNKNARESDIIYLTDREDSAEPECFIENESELIEEIKKLPAKYKHVVFSIAVEGYSSKETALRLGISEANVRKRYERGKRLLKSRINQAKESEVLSRKGISDTDNKGRFYYGTRYVSN